MRGRWVVALASALVSLLVSRRASSPPAPPGAPPPPADPPDAWGTRADLASGCAPIGPVPPGVAAFRAWALARGGRDGGVWRACEVGGRSEHHEGRAWDWMIDVPTGRALVDELLADGAALARRAGVLYLIHDRRIWRAYEPRGWSPYTGRNPHTDHVHFSFTRAGAAGRTSFYQGGMA